jgi:hypothetical protein
MTVKPLGFDQKEVYRMLPPAREQVFSVNGFDLIATQPAQQVKVAFEAVAG